MLLCVLPVLIRKLICALSGHYMNIPGNHFSYLHPSGGVFSTSRRGRHGAGRKHGVSWRSWTCGVQPSGPFTPRENVFDVWIFFFDLFRFRLFFVLSRFCAVWTGPYKSSFWRMISSQYCMSDIPFNETLPISCSWNCALQVEWIIGVVHVGCVGLEELVPPVGVGAEVQAVHPHHHFTQTPVLVESRTLLFNLDLKTQYEQQLLDLETLEQSEYYEFHSWWFTCVANLKTSTHSTFS